MNYIDYSIIKNSNVHKISEEPKRVYSDLHVGEIIKFKQAKNNKVVAFTNYGKVVLHKNDNIETGYYQVNQVSDRGNYYIVDAVRVFGYDYYYGITVKEMKSVLINNGYKIAYSHNFKYNYGKNNENIPEITDELQILAYNVNTNIVIQAETFANMAVFNKIDMYCPGVNGLKPMGRGSGFWMGSYRMATFNLVNSRFETGPIHMITRNTESSQYNYSDGTGKMWIDEESILLRNYADSDKFDNDQVNVERLSEASIENLIDLRDKVFKGNTRMVKQVILALAKKGVF